MSVTSKIYIVQGGATSLTDSALAYTTITRVQRSGVEHDIVTTTPTSRQVKYTSNEGKLTFLIPFNGNGANDVDDFEDIIVTYNV